MDSPTKTMQLACFHQAKLIRATSNDSLRSHNQSRVTSRAGFQHPIACSQDLPRRAEDQAYSKTQDEAEWSEKPHAPDCKTRLPASADRGSPDTSISFARGERGEWRSWRSRNRTSP